MKLRIEIQEKKLDDLYLLASTIQEDEVKSHFAKYLCIRTSGLLENLLKDLFREYVDGSCPKEVSNFIEDRMKNFTNISAEKLGTFLSTLNEKWLDQYNIQITEKQKESLNSIIANRNQIAHGQTDNISLGQMQKYYVDIKEVFKILKGIIRKNPRKYKY